MINRKLVYDRYIDDEILLQKSCFNLKNIASQEHWLITSFIEMKKTNKLAKKLLFLCKTIRINKTATISSKYITLVIAIFVPKPCDKLKIAD